MTRSQSISPKKRVIFLYCSIGFLLLMIHQLCFRKTFTLFTTYQNNSGILQQALNAPKQIGHYQTQLSSLDNQIPNKEYNRTFFFQVVNTFCLEHNLELAQFAPEIKRQEGEIEIITNQIEVQGTYQNMLRLCYELEYLQSLGHIASIKFKKVQDIRTRKNHLMASIFLQNIRLSTSK